MWSLFPALAAARLRRKVHHTLATLPVATAGHDTLVGPPGFETIGPRLWISVLAAEAMWLGSYQKTYDFTEDQWADVATHLSGYANLPLVRPLNVTPAYSPNDERLRDERPLVDAVLRLAQQRSLHTVTISDVATASGYNPDTLRATFGTMNELMADVIRQIHNGGFDAISPLWRDLDRHSMALSLQGLEDERNITTIHRLYALADVPTTAHRPIRARARMLGKLSTRYFDHLDLMTATLAINGWQGARAHLPTFYPTALPDIVVLELARLTKLRPPA